MYHTEQTADVWTFKRAEELLESQSVNKVIV